MRLITTKTVNIWIQLDINRITRKEVLLVTKNKPLPAVCVAIKKKMIEVNMSQRELAEAIGMNEKYLTELLRGRKGNGKRGSKYFQEIYKVLDIDEREILD